MIINLRFGYAARHHVYYDTDRKRGTIKLWSCSSPITGGDSIETFPSRPGILSEILFRENQQIEFAIADEEEILSMLASLDSVRIGNHSSFTSKEGRKITFSWNKEVKSKKDLITVKIQYSKAAVLTMGEAHKLHTIAKQILREMGFSEQEISEKLERLA